MNDLNQQIGLTQQFTAPASMDTIPTVDHSQQIALGLEMAQRAAQQQAPPPPAPMPPIVPVAN